MDVSFNKISNIKYEEIPTSIELLQYSNNPISKVLFYNYTLKILNDRLKLLKILPYIDEIDDTPVSREERFHALEMYNFYKTKKLP